MTGAVTVVGLVGVGRDGRAGTDTHETRERDRDREQLNRHSSPSTRAASAMSCMQ
jgi:hypothetical protein